MLDKPNALDCEWNLLRSGPPTPISMLRWPTPESLSPFSKHSGCINWCGDRSLQIGSGWPNRRKLGIRPVANCDGPADSDRRHHFLAIEALL